MSARPYHKKSPKELFRAFIIIAVPLGGIFSVFALSDFLQSFFWGKSSTEYFLQGSNGGSSKAIFPFLFWVIFLMPFCFGVSEYLRKDQEKRDKVKKELKTYARFLSWTFLICSLWFFIWGGNFFYISQTRIDYRPPLKVDIHSYQWSDIQYAEIRCDHGTKNSNEFDYKLHLSDDTTINISKGQLGRFFTAYQQLKKLIDAYKVTEKVISSNNRCINYYKSDFPDYAYIFDYYFRR